MTQHRTMIGNGYQTTARRLSTWLHKGMLLVLLALSFSHAIADEPIVLTSTVSTKDAPVVTPKVHGRIGQNVRVLWSTVAAGPTKGHDALYFFVDMPREKNIGGGSPVMTRLDLADGAIKEFYPSTKIKTREKAADLDMDMGLGDLAANDEPTTMKVPWPWGMPACGVRGPNGDFHFCTKADDNTKPTLIRYIAREGVFEELDRLPAEPTGIAYHRGTLRIITAAGKLYAYDDLTGTESAGRIPGRAKAVSRLVADEKGYLYTVIGENSPVVTALTINKKAVRRTALLKGKHIERVSFRDNVPGPLCDVVVKEGDRFHRETYTLLGGKATKLNGPADMSGFVAKRGYEVKADFDARPPKASVRRKGSDWKHYPITFKNAGWDKIKCMRAGPRGKYLYGGGWPVAWIWRFDPATGELRVLGRHYVFYEIHPWKDELWVTGYWGIKLLRWHPEDPWTFDYPRHYGKKKYPGNTSPWGDKGVSNPRLVCKFRYLKKLHVRRPGGMTMGPDGRVYIGGRTPAVEYFNSRYGGAVSWYDEKTETIGAIREPFLHHSVRDVCSAGNRYIVAAASRYISPFEPLPKDFNPGKFVLYDTQTQKVVMDTSPLGTALSYAEEGEPGHVVVAGYAGKYSGKGIRGAFFLFDVKQMRVTHVIRTPFRVGWSEYNVLPFERGPDKKIYFYGADRNGVAMFRIDSVTGKIDPVLRAKGVTTAATISNKGAPFAFLGDRAYFGVHQLMSLPLETVVGGAKKQ